MSLIKARFSELSTQIAVQLLLTCWEINSVISGVASGETKQFAESQPISKKVFTSKLKQFYVNSRLYLMVGKVNVSGVKSDDIIHVCKY